MARQGGLGVLHRNLSIEDQATHVDKVKRSESGMITNPVTTTPDATVAEVDALCGQFRVSRPAGRRGRRHARRHHHQPRHALRLAVREGHDARARRHDEAAAHHRDRAASTRTTRSPSSRSTRSRSCRSSTTTGRLRGLITVKDFDKSEKYPNATKDDAGRLRVGAAIGFFGDAWDRAGAASTPVSTCIVVDTANGDSRGRARHHPPAQGRPGVRAHRRHRRQRRDPQRRAGAHRRRRRRRSRSASARARSAPRASSPASACRR